MPFRLRKIISGGQTGADRAGLEIAKELGYETGGFVPKGWKTENGPDLTLMVFGCVELSSTQYPARTIANIRAADATVIFGRDPLDGGSLKTLEWARSNKKPYWVNPNAEMLRGLLEMGRVEILNVAGNRASKDPEVAERVKRVLREALRG